MKLVELNPGFFSFLDSDFIEQNSDLLLIEAGAPSNENDPGVYVSDNPDGQKFVEVMANFDLPNLIQKSSPFFLEDLSACCKILSNPKQVLNDECLSLMASCKREGSFKFNANEGKEELFSGLRDIVSSRQLRNSIADNIYAVAEELFMNAAYDAPKELGAKPATDPKSHMHVDINDERIQLTTVDFYGSLKAPKFINRIKTVFRQGPGDSINWGDGGAGLGSTILVEKCSRILMAVDPGKKTIVSCSVPIRLNLREQIQMGRCLFTFENIE
ncbi:MAG: hypothetical protein AB7O96_15070 [Pseudobdellovibrionaceae bacterium]